MDQELRQIQPQQSGTGTIILVDRVLPREDYNPDLQGQSASQRYHRMRRDPEIYAALATIKSILSGALWRWELPQEVQNDATAKEQKALCERYIMGEGRSDPRATFKGGLLPHILLMLDYGMSAMEKVWGVNETGKQVYARLVPILPWTIQEFKIDQYGQVAKIVQLAYAPSARGGYILQRKEIPELDSIDADDKIAVFTFRQEGDNYFGESMLRACYQPWYHKSELWMIDAQQKEIAGRGYRIITVPDAATSGSDSYISAEKIAKTLELGWAVIGESWKVDTQFPSGTAPDLRGSLEYADTQMARALGTEFQHLGTTNSGSRAVGQVQSDNMLLKVQAVADLVEEFVNTQLRNALLRRNYGPVKFPPVLKCEDLLRMQGLDKAETLKALTDAGLIKPDRKLEERLRAENDLPEIDDSTREEAPPLRDNGAGATTATPNGKPSASLPPVSKAVPAVDTSPRFWRDLMAHEAHVDFNGIADYLDVAPQNVWHRTVEPFRAQIIKRVAVAAGKATDSALERGQLFGVGEKRPLERRLADELGSELMSAYRRGRADVISERDKQLTKADSYDEGDDTEPSSAQESWVRRIAGGFAATMYLGLISAAIKSAFTSRQANLPTSDVERRALLALNDLSVPTATADLAGALTRAYTNGRTDQGKAMSSQIETVYYSAVMDTGTCAPCMAYDKQEIDMSEVDSLIPNPDCDGDIRCRCEPIFIFKGKEAA